MSGLKKNVLT